MCDFFGSFYTQKQPRTNSPIVRTFINAREMWAIYSNYKNVLFLLHCTKTKQKERQRERESFFTNRISVPQALTQANKGENKYPNT